MKVSEYGKRGITNSSNLHLYLLDDVRSKFLKLFNVCVYSLGLEGVDKEKAHRIVYEMSKGSKYFQNEERKEALMKQKMEHMRDRSAKLSSSDLSNYQKVCLFSLFLAIIRNAGCGIFHFLFS